MSKSDLGVALELLSSYCGCKVKTVNRCAQGVAAENYHVGMLNSREFLLRIDQRRKYDAVAADDHYMKFAQQAGLAVPEVSTKWETASGGAIVIRPWLQGKTLMGSGDLQTFFRPICENLQKLHSISVGYSPLPRRTFFYEPLHAADRKRWGILSKSQYFLKRNPNAIKAIESALEIVKCAPRELLASSPSGIIHGDISPSNIIVHNAAISFIDWEKACFGPIFSDVAQFIYYFITPCQSDNEAANEILKIYQGPTETYHHEGLTAWCRYHPLYMFLHDSARTIEELSRGNSNHYSYLISISLPRIQAHMALYFKNH